VVEVLTVVMDTLRATVIVWGFHPGSCTAGLLTSRVAGFMCAFPVSQWHSSHKTSPLTVAGAVTVLAPFGSSAPCSLLGSSTSWFLSTEHSLCASWWPVPSTCFCDAACSGEGPAKRGSGGGK
jgi:hypothetical protein